MSTDGSEIVSFDPAQSELPEVMPADPFSDDGILPLVFLERASPDIRRDGERFYNGVPDMLEAFIQKNKNPNTQRSYRRAIMNFIEFMGFDWPQDGWRMLRTVGVEDVRAWRDLMDAKTQAPATLNHRLAGLSSFYKYMREIAESEMKLPVLVPNPAHVQFIGRQGKDPVRPTSVMTLSVARKFMAPPTGEDEFTEQHRTILKTFLYAGVRIRTATLLDVSDFHNDPENPTLLIREKGHGTSKREIGIHFTLAQALQSHIETSKLQSGPLFRAQIHPKIRKFGENRMSVSTMDRLLRSYFHQLPGALIEVVIETAGEEGHVETRCRYSPHALRATTATLLDSVGVRINKIQELLGHKDIRVTQNYIKLGQDTRESASHDVPL